MRYTRTALGLLTRQYRSVLKKCLMMNLGVFAYIAPLQAAQTAVSYDDLVAKLAASSTADVILNMNGAGINLPDGTDKLTITPNQKVAIKNVGTLGSSSWNNGSGDPFNGASRTPSPSIIWNYGTLSIDNSIFSNNYVDYDSTNIQGLIRNVGTDTLVADVSALPSQLGTITAITNSYFTDNYIRGDAVFGGVIGNTQDGRINLIQNVVIKNITWKTDNNAPHAGAIENIYGGKIDKIDNLTIQNVYMETHRAESVTDTTGAGGNHGVLENNQGGIIGDITNLTIIGNYLYRPGEYDITDVIIAAKQKPNNHATAAGIYNQGKINSITHALFQDNHTKTEMIKADAGGGAVASFMGNAISYDDNTYDDEGVPRRYCAASGYIGKMDDVQFIHNYVEAAGDAYGGAMYAGGGGYIKDGIIYNGTLTELTNAVFERNFASSTDKTASAGALRITYATVDKLEASFTDNYASAAKSEAYGGALLLKSGFVSGGYVSNSDIKQMKADFSGNYVSAYTEARGGALYNTGTIRSMVGDFLNNHVSAQTVEAAGGAIAMRQHYSTDHPDIVSSATITSIRRNL